MRPNIRPVGNNDPHLADQVPELVLPLLGLVLLHLQLALHLLKVLCGLVQLDLGIGSGLKRTVA